MSKALLKYRGHPEKIVAYLSKALERDERSDFPRAIMEVVREFGVATIAERTGLRRETIYRSLNGKQKPTFYVIVKILAALGVGIVLQEVQNKSRSGVGLSLHGDDGS
jgi:probable addiction module antidote protein